MKIKNILITTFIFITMLISLTSCSKANVYDLYKKEGIDISKDNVYELITVEELLNIKTENDELIYVFYGQASNFQSQSAISTIDTQAKQFNIETIYYINADDHNISKEARNDLKKNIGINDAAYVPTLLAYSGQALPEKCIFDLSKDSFKRHFKNEDNIDYVKLAGFMFRDKCNLEELPPIE